MLAGQMQLGAWQAQRAPARAHRSRLNASAPCSAGTAVPLAQNRRPAARRRVGRRAGLSISAQAGQLQSQVAVVLGSQWGDEGKGKLVDILAQQYDVVARAQVGQCVREQWLFMPLQAARWHAHSCRQDMNASVQLCRGTLLSMIQYDPDVWNWAGWRECRAHDL